MSRQQNSFELEQSSCSQTGSSVPTVYPQAASSSTVRTAPLRRCAACRRVAPRTDFLRLIRQYDSGEVRIGRGMGRSAYLCPTQRCVERMRKKNRLRHVLRATVTDDLFTSLLATIEAAETGSANAAGLAIDE